MPAGSNKKSRPNGGFLAIVQSMFTRRTVLGWVATAALSSVAGRAGIAAPIMTPATATVQFQHMASDTIIRPSFVEFLWREVSGEIDCHLEIDTRQFTDASGVTHGRRGKFRRGGTRLLFRLVRSRPCADRPSVLVAARSYVAATAAKERSEPIRTHGAL